MKCFDPYPVEMDAGMVHVGCGSCPHCRKRRINEWTARLLKEEEKAKSSYFVTLTYSKETVPRTKNGWRTLRKADVQLFFKRLRHHHGKASIYSNEIKQREIKNIKDFKELSRNYKPTPIKYYACGEYGSATKRPHYHALIFNAAPEDIEKAWGYVSEGQIGLIHIGQVSQASIRYCLKYMDKESNVPHWPFDGEKEFQIMSKGIGKCYTDDPVMVNYHRKDPSRNYITMPEGWKCSMPRYWSEVIWPKGTTDRKKLREHIAQAMKENVEERVQKLERKGKSYRDYLRNYQRKLTLDSIKSNTLRSKL